MVKDEIIKQVEQENVTQLKKWKQKAGFAGMLEDLDKYNSLQFSS